MSAAHGARSWDEVAGSPNVTYKTRDRVGNWRVYERALVSRGDVTLWLSPDARAAWGVPPSGRPGGQPRFSDLAIETALTLRLVFHVPLRQTEGFVRSILTVMRAGLDAPDHTTLSRRSQMLDVAGHDVPARGPLHLIVDSTGLSVVGEGEWAAATHGGRGNRGWKTLHLGVDRASLIVAHALTEATVDDATVGSDLIGAAAGRVASVTGDAAYDTVAFDEAASARHARVVVPPARTAKVSRRGPRSSARDRCDRRRGNARAAPMEEGLGLPPAGSCGERLLPGHVHHWGWPTRPQSWWPARRGEPGVQRPESDDRAWQAPVDCDPSVTRPWVGKTASPGSSHAPTPRMGGCDTRRTGHARVEDAPSRRRPLRRDRRACADRGDGRRCDCGRRSDWCDSRRRGQRHRGWRCGLPRWGSDGVSPSTAPSESSGSSCGGFAFGIALSLARHAHDDRRQNRIRGALADFEAQLARLGRPILEVVRLADRDRLLRQLRGRL